MTDVLEELDHWLRGSVQAEPHLILKRARDEIVALRAQLEAVAPLQIAIADALAAARREARTQALEEAALVCERRRDETGRQEAYAVLDAQSYTSACGGCAFDIRALKEKPDE